MKILYHPRKLARVKYGLLYNWYAATDVRGIASAGWHVPSIEEWSTLCQYLGGVYIDDTNQPLSYTLTGDDVLHLCDTNINYWEDAIGTNEIGFTARGSGFRCNEIDCNYYYINYVAEYLSTDVQLNNYILFATILIFGNYYIFSVTLGDNDFAFNVTPKYGGGSIRLLKDGEDPEKTNYTGNDGKTYLTVKIGTQVWMAENLAETKYANGDTIPEVTDNDDWLALTSGALCAYDNDWNNV
jgi:uncharacterized protein (TIGR02145 family)